MKDKGIYVFDDTTEKHVIMITEEQKKVFDWLKSIGYDYINLEKVEDLTGEE